mgnify:CR=1 FL=1
MDSPNKKFEAGVEIFSEGAAPTAIFIITKGSVSVRKKTESGFVEIAVIEPGEFLGEVSFFDREPRSASAVALTDVELAEISFAYLDKLFGATPKYLKVLIRGMALRLRKSNELIWKLKTTGT